MADKKCPNCNLWNISTALRCDCGYDFESGVIEKTYIQEKFPAKKINPIIVKVRDMTIGFFGWVLLSNLAFFPIAYMIAYMIQIFNWNNPPTRWTYLPHFLPILIVTIGLLITKRIWMYIGVLTAVTFNVVLWWASFGVAAFDNDFPLQPIIIPLPAGIIFLYGM